MATIDATVAGADSNSYITLANADAWFGDRLIGKRWDDFDDTDKTLALIEATTMVDRLRLIGCPYDISTPQALHYPRSDDYDVDGDLEIPQGVEDAVCLQALHLLEQQATPELLDRRALQHQGVRGIAMDGISETYKAAGDAAAWSPDAWQCIVPFVRMTARVPTRG